MAVSEFSDVFVSYRRKNVDFTKQIVDELRKHDKEVWVDWEDIPPGSVGFTNDIQKGIEGADTFVAILSPDYMESEYCIMELDYAIKMNKKLIPIVFQKFDDYPVPSGIGHINWIYFTPHAGQENSFETSFPKVMDAIDTDLEHVRRHKRLLIRALEWENNGRKSGFLLMGAELEEAAHWIIEGANKEPHPTELQLAFIEEGHEYTERRQRMILTGVTTALVVSLILTVISIIFFFQAQTERYLSNVRLLANRLPAISANEPFVARSIAGAMLELDNLPSVASAAAQNILLTSAAVDSFEGHTDIVLDVEFINEGTQFVSASADGSIQLWDTGEHQARQSYNGYDEGVGILNLAVSPDGLQMLSGADDGLVILWDITSGNEITRFEEHTNEVHAVTFLSDGTPLTGDADGHIYIWDTETGEILQDLSLEDDFVYEIALSADDSIMVGAGASGRLIVCDMETGEILASMVGHRDEIYSVDITADGTRAVSGSADNLIYMWDIDNLERDGAPFVGHRDEVWGVRFNHAGDSIISVAGDRTLRIWDFNERSIPRTLTGHSGWINKLDIAPGDNLVVSSADDNTIILWDIGISSLIEEYRPSNQRILSMAVSADESIVVAGMDDGAVAFLNTVSNEMTRLDTEDRSRVEAMVFAPDSNILFTGHCKNLNERPCTQGEVIRWDAEVQTILDRFEAGTGLITDMSSGTNATFGTVIAVSTTGENDAILFDAESGEELMRFVGHTDAIDGVAISPDGEHLLTASRDGLVILWSLTDSSLIREFSGHHDWVANVTWFPDNRYALSSSWDGTLIHWDTQASEDSDPVINVLEGHQGAVMNVDISSDGTTAISGSRDSVVIIWDIETGESIRTLNGHANDVIDLVWTDNDKRAYSASFDSTVRYWQVFLDDVATASNDAVTQIDVCSTDGNSISIANQYDVPQLCGNFFERFMANFSSQ